MLSQCGTNGVGGSGGDPLDDGSGSTPIPFSAITAGYNHSCAPVGASDQALCWGHGLSGQLGNGATMMIVNMRPTKDQTSPVAVWDVGATVSNTLTEVITISAGYNHTCAVQGSQKRAPLLGVWR